MRIVYLHQYYNTPAESGGTRSYEMARRLVARGHEVHMVTSDRSAERRKKWRLSVEDGISVHRFPVHYSNALGFARRLLSFSEFAAVAAPKARSLDGDVVFASSTPLTIALPAVYGARACGSPMVFEVRDLWPDVPIAMGTLNSPLTKLAARRLERFAYEHATRIIALSPGMADGVARTGYDSQRITVIPNSCDFDLFDIPPERGKKLRGQFSWLGDRPLVVYAGTLGAVNGVEYLAKLAARVANIAPEVRFMVVGDGAQEHVVRTTAHRLGILNHNFFMFPAQPKASISEVLSAATVCTSLVIDLKELWSNSANKFFDALAASRPIGVNHGGWQAELLEATGSGFVLHPTDIDNAAWTLKGVLEDESWLAQARASARLVGSERFSRDKLAESLEEVLKSAVAEGPAW